LVVVDGGEEGSWSPLGALIWDDHWHCQEVVIIGRGASDRAFCIAKTCAHQDLSWRRLAAADRVSSEAEGRLQSMASLAQNLPWQIPQKNF
jgi:hypothetical protein